MNPGKHDPDSTAYILAGTDRRISYGELERSSNQIAQLLRSLGLVRGDSIAICLENHVSFLAICWAAQRIGIYYTPISYRLQSEEVAYIVNDCNAKVLITSHALAETFAALQGKLTNRPVCFMLDGEVEGAACLESAIADKPVDPVPDESNGTHLLYSSGTTGKPKGIKRPLPETPWGEDDPTSQTRRDRYGLDNNAVYLSPAPLYHAAPLAFTMCVTRYGGTCVIMEQFDARQALQLIEKHKITHSQWVPTMFVRMLKLPADARSGIDLSSHKLAIHAAAPCPVAVKEQMIQWWGPIIYEYYGGTEANGSTAITSEEWLTHRGSVGRAVGCQVHILDDNDEELPIGETGGVYFEGGAKFEYLHDEEKTKASQSAQGWTTMGDVGYLDEEGYLYLTDRKSFTIISGGVNIYPQETENILIAHPTVYDVAVFGVPNEEFGEEVKAVVQPADMTSAGAVLEAELIEYARARISHIKCPRSIDFVEELPRHPTGKLYKRLLKDKYWE